MPKVILSEFKLTVINMVYIVLWIFVNKIFEHRMNPIFVFRSKIVSHGIDDNCCFRT